MLTLHTHTKAQIRAQRGLSLVEMMVGLAVGLIVSAAAASMMLAQLRESRKLTTETQLQQDLRAIAELMSRELRRAGYWAAPGNGVWAPGDATDAPLNPYRAMTFSPTSNVTGVTGGGPYDYVSFATSSGQRNLTTTASSPSVFEDGVVTTSEQRGFRLISGVLSFFDGANWQPLNVLSQMSVTSFSIRPSYQCLPANEFSAVVCPLGSSSCTPPPGTTVLTLDVSMTGRASSDSSITRTADFRVKVINNGNCP